MFVLSAATAILFLGGWATPAFLHSVPGIGVIVFGVKWAALLFLMLWVRWTFPRTRLDQVMHVIATGAKLQIKATVLCYLR